MPVQQGCIAALIGTAAQVWGFIKSNEGQLLTVLILGAHTFTSRLRRLPGPELTDFANTLMFAIIFVLFILATETKLYYSIRTGLDQCTEKLIAVATLESAGQPSRRISAASANSSNREYGAAEKLASVKKV
jgi:hypothetical protein